MSIAILGGGVAGVSSALALKNKGFDVTIYERHKSEANIGAGIVVWPNATYILEQLGVLDEIKRKSVYPSSMQRFSNTGENLGSIDIEQINNLMGYPSLSILRYDFQRILLSKLNEVGVTIKYEYEITEIYDSKSEGIITAGRSLASSLFNPDPKFCKVRNEKSKNTNYSKVAKAMAQGWSQGLPINA